MTRIRFTCSLVSAMSVAVGMAVVLGTVVPAQAGPTFSVSNLITNNQSDNQWDCRSAGIAGELQRP